MTADQKNIDNIHAKPMRRTFTTQYKLRILDEIDRADQKGQIALILRREGLFSSHLADWRKWREQLSISGNRQPIESHTSKLKRENERLLRQNRRLQEKLDQAKLIIQLQKKLELNLAMMENISDDEPAL